MFAGLPAAAFRFAVVTVLRPALVGGISSGMMCRYQMWGAAISCLLIAVSPGFTALNILISLLAAGMIGNELLAIDPSRSLQLHSVLTSFSIDEGWIMITIALVCLYAALIRRDTYSSSRVNTGSNP
jgi:hypothetical protein